MGICDKCKLLCPSTKMRQGDDPLCEECEAKRVATLAREQQQRKLRSFSTRAADGETPATNTNSTQMPSTSLREMGSHLLMVPPPTVKRYPHILQIYTTSSIVIMVDREMETWYDVACVFVGIMNNAWLMARSDRTRHGGYAHHAVLCRIQSGWWVKRYSHYSRVWTVCEPVTTRSWTLSRT